MPSPEWMSDRRAHAAHLCGLLGRWRSGALSLSARLDGLRVTPYAASVAMRIVEPGDPAYDASRRISNARFDYRPRYICYCERADDVPAALSMARKESLPVRIRSGGHQHEGMCSANGVLLIDLSEINTISVAEDQAVARIGTGAKLADVYRTLLADNLILPGGGCGDVRVGGLVQGGGWGLYSRALGLTCDRLIGFVMVKADGDTIEVTPTDNRYADLF